MHFRWKMKWVVLDFLFLVVVYYLVKKKNFVKRPELVIPQPEPVPVMQQPLRWSQLKTAWLCSRQRKVSSCIFPWTCRTMRALQIKTWRMMKPMSINWHWQSLPLPAWQALNLRISMVSLPSMVALVRKMTLRNISICENLPVLVSWCIQ